MGTAKPRARRAGALARLALAVMLAVGMAPACTIAAASEAQALLNAPDTALAGLQAYADDEAPGAEENVAQGAQGAQGAEGAGGGDEASEGDGAQAPASPEGSEDGPGQDGYGSDADGVEQGEQVEGGQEMAGEAQDATAGQAGDGEGDEGAGAEAQGTQEEQGAEQQGAQAAGGEGAQDSQDAQGQDAQSADGSSAASASAQAAPLSTQDKAAGTLGSGMGAQAITISSVVPTELRKGKDRTSSPLPAQTIVLNNGGHLDLHEATIVSKASDVERSTHNRGKYGAGSTMYGIWIKNPKGDSGSTKTVTNPVTLKWSNAATDLRGNSLDFQITVHSVTLKQGYNASGSDWVCLMGDGSGHTLTLNAQAEPSESNDTVAARVGVNLDVTCSFLYAGTSNPAQGSYLFSMYDIDIFDKVSLSSVGYYYDDSRYVYTEGVILQSGFSSTLYSQKTIASGDGLDPGAWLLKVENSSGRITGYYDTDGSVDHGYETEYRAGFAIGAQPTFRFNWTGSDCATAILQVYEPVTIRDKNDSSTAGTTDQAIISKNVNDVGQVTSGGFARTSSDFRTTSMPWKGASTYTFAAKEGYRLTNVRVQAKTSGWTRDLGAVSGISFAETADLDHNVFATTQDYDIIATTVKVTGAAAALTATKKLTGKTLAANEYAFELYEGTTKLATAKNDASGKVSFPEISYVYSASKTYPITHTYTMKEVAGTDAYTTYDTASKTVTVLEKFDSSANKLTATITGNNPTFANTYYPTGGVRAKKVNHTTGAALAGAVFTVEKTDSHEKWTMTTNNSGIAELGATKLPVGSYTIYETTAPSGFGVNTAWKKSFEVKLGKVTDLTSDPCPDPVVPTSIAMPSTGQTGLAATVTAGLAAIAAGIGVRRKTRGQKISRDMGEER